MLTCWLFFGKRVPPTLGMVSLLSFLIYFSATVKVAAATFGNETDRLALLALKDLITEDPLRSLASWNYSLPHCKWHGVTCSRKHGRVVVLDLQFQGLAGSISPSLGNLTFLRYIHLQSNHLRGKIPQELGHLFHLRHLNLTNNTIQGEIPANLSNCSQLRAIDLISNGLVGKIPSRFGSLSKLIVLYLAVNNLTGGIPPSLGNLTFLQAISLGRNNLSGTIPDSIGHLTKLAFLGFGQDKLTGTVPPSIYNISSLEELFLTENQLTGSLPLDIGLTLPNISKMCVGRNQFTGPFPISLSNSSEMTLLELFFNGLSGPVPIDLGRRMKNLWGLNLGFNYFGAGEETDLSFVDSLTNCTKLQILGLYGNGFGGVLPKSLANLSTQLSYLHAGENQLVGTIPAGISNLVNLVFLVLYRNHLSGPIPLEIGKLSNLRRGFLDGNNLSGPIPLSFGNLTQIYEIHLEENNFTGRIPSSIKNIPGLQVLNISCNRFVGSIPRTIGYFSTLSSINLGHNSFSGLLPSELGFLNNLEELDVSNNKFSGKIPTTLGACLKLESLHLEGNMFMGKIPPSFGSLRGIVYLDLSRNNLTGQIPIGLETLPFLENLNLSLNDLEGEVSSKGVFRNSSKISLFGNTKLCGGILELHLPSCPTRKSTKKRYPHVVTIIACIVGTGLGLLMITLLVFVLRQKREKRTKSPTETRVGDEFMRVSYEELFKATEGFASANIIGAGSFSTVYKGVLHPDEKPVAVKVLNLDRLGASKSFIAECEALRNTRHRNLLKVITACSSVNIEGNDFKALVFDFMPNGSLENWLHQHEDSSSSQKRNLKLTQRLDIAIDVANALDYLHHHCESPMVHCDLKPSNVLLDEEMTAHVGDFGLARFLTINTDDIGGRTSSIAIKGSIGYVAPEYGVGGHLSTQGDIYSYGILLLEMVTGKRPTDEMFTNGLSLHKFCKMALPKTVNEVVDSSCLQIQEPNEAMSSSENQSITPIEMMECLSSLVRIGLACSEESPIERMDISNVVAELNIMKGWMVSQGRHPR